MEEIEQEKEKAEAAAKASVDFSQGNLEEFATGEDLVKDAQERLDSLKAAYSHQLGYDAAVDQDLGEKT